jgi:transcriptional antiterminator RfaH
MSQDRNSVELNGGCRWYAVQAQPAREQLALRHLSRQGFEAFCPVQTRARRIGRHSVTRLAPFFPGYLFVRLDLERQRWRSVNGTTGVLRLVGSGDRGRARPTPVPEGVVERLRELSRTNGELSFRPEFVEGDAVRVVAGPFDQLCGVLEQAGHHERVTILLEILSTEVRVKVSRSLLIAA